MNSSGAVEITVSISCPLHVRGIYDSCMIVRLEGRIATKISKVSSAVDPEPGNYYQ